MPEQYVATDKRTGVEVAVTGEFPPHPEDRVRIARTATLFTRLMSTILGMEERERRQGFRAVETQLELADALIRQDMESVRRLVRQTMESMGVTEGQLNDLARQLRDLSGNEEMSAEEIARALGLPPDEVRDRLRGLEHFFGHEQAPAESVPDALEGADATDGEGATDGDRPADLPNGSGESPADPDADPPAASAPPPA